MRHLLPATAIVFAALILGESVVPASSLSPHSSRPNPDVPATQLLKTVVNHELAADKQDESLWMYTSDMRKAGSDVTQEVVQTKQGTLYLHLAINGKPLTPSQQAKERQRIRKVTANRDEPQKLKREQSQDGDKAQQMLALLPQALIASYGEHRGELVALNFKPNPDYHPTSHEAQVFGAMTGTIWVNPREDRLAEIDGHLTREVKFGGGLLGHLDKGGQFRVVQSEVQPGHWEITRLNVNMNGKALFFKSIAVRQDETRTKYKQMPDNFTLEQAAEMLSHIFPQTTP